MVNKGIGGIMIWELAGDYAYNAAKGQYVIGDTLTDAMYDEVQAAAPYGAKKAGAALPTQALNVGRGVRPSSRWATPTTRSPRS